jgi:hypothetical protein
MKRSEINTLMQDALAFFQQNKFYLPPFARWTPQDWAVKSAEVSEIVHNELGWDLTDYGLGQFQHFGLLLFTLRNGNMAAWRSGHGKPYAEKVMIAEVDQVHQMHFHWRKVEDIINRAGGSLAIELYNATEDDQLADTPITVSVDGEVRRLPAGEVVLLKPGESITLHQRLYHRFWAEGQRVMMGEVSTVNDDKDDNCFYQPIGSGRFGAIEEDVEPLYLLFSDYTRYWRGQQLK